MKKHQCTKHLSHVANYVSNTGRSMVEMLGTLAIMGMLTIGAVSGIRYVMDKNTANAIMKEALTQASEIKVRRRQNIDTDGKIRYAYKNKSEYIISREYNASDKKIILKTGPNITVGVCEKLVGKNVSIFTSIESSEGSCKTYNTMIFTTDTI